MLLRIDLAALGASHVVPGGGATSAGLRYRLLTRARVDGRTAVATTAIQTVSAMSALVVIFAVGVVLTLGHTGDHALFEIAGAVALVLMLAFCTVVEGVLVPVLVSAGSPHAVALLGVLIWRLVEFWLPIPVSGLGYLSLRLGPLRDHDRVEPRISA